MNYNRFSRLALGTAASMFIIAGVSLAQDAGTPTDPSATTDPVTITDPAPDTEDATEDSTDKSGPGAAVSVQAKTLKDVEGPRKDAAKALKTTALTNNPGFQTATTKRNANANKDEEDGTSKGTSGDHPTADDHPGKDDHPDSEDNPGNEDHPTADDHPDAEDNPGDLASEDHGKPDDLPTPEDHPGADDHPTGHP